jgi:glycolate oxidase iron-sulfur subunit
MVIASRGRLLVRDDDLGSCVGCGLCLPHCPTYRTTGDEVASPRGRIALMRQVQWEGADIGEEFASHMDACVQCRGCEPACPSSVPFGRLMEGTRATLARRGVIAPRWLRLALGGLAFHRPLVASARAASALRRILPARVRAVVPTAAPLRPPRLRSTGHDVWLFTGCVMDAWQRDVHVASQRVLEATGLGVALPERRPGGGCCGALSAHAGLLDQSRWMVRRVMRTMPGDAPIVVNSAGCGAHLKDVGHLLGTDEAAVFAARVVDVHELVAARVDRIASQAAATRPRVAIHDPCHLRHVQRAHGSVRTALAPFADVVELDDDGLCCGAGGAYSVLHPDAAAQMRNRKVAAVERSGASAVVSANPGCTLHLAGELAARDVTIEHPMQVIARSMSGEGVR